MTKKKRKAKRNSPKKEPAEDRILGSVHSAETEAERLLALASEVEKCVQEILSKRGVVISRGTKRAVAVVHDGPYNERPAERIPEPQDSLRQESRKAARRHAIVYQDPRDEQFWRRYTRPPEEPKPWELMARTTVVKDVALPVLKGSKDNVAELAGALLADACILRQMVASKDHDDGCLEEHLARERAALKQLLDDERRARQDPRTRALAARRARAKEKREKQKQELIQLAREAYDLWLKEKPEGRPTLKQIQFDVVEMYVDENGKRRLSHERIQKLLTKRILEEAGLILL